MQATEHLQIVRADSPAEFAHIRGLFDELSAWDSQMTASLGYDSDAMLDFYYQQSVVELPGEYAPPDGDLLLALYGNEAAGCAALKRFDGQSCEMKRMYVRPAFRGKKIGRTLLDRLLQQGREAGYQRALLETVTFMQDAHALYRSFGFEMVEPYYTIPDEFKPMTLFMELKL